MDQTLAQDQNIDKIEQGNHLNTDSFWGIMAALFLLLIYNDYLFQSFFALFRPISVGSLSADTNINTLFINQYLIIPNLIWYVIFFMAQAGILKVVYRKLILRKFVVYSPVKSIWEFTRFVFFLGLGATFFGFIFNFLYPFKIFSTSLVDQAIFYVVSFGISICYWKYVESYDLKQVYVPKLGQYGVMGWITITFCLMAFGTAAVIFPYSLFGVMGFGVWLIMISRFLLEA